MVREPDVPVDSRVFERPAVPTSVLVTRAFRDCVARLGGRNSAAAQSEEGGGGREQFGTTRHHVGGQGIAVDENALLLRGSHIHGVDEAVGVVVYTGDETKARVRQAQAPRARLPLSEQLLNQHIAVAALLLAVFCAVGATMFATWAHDHRPFATEYLRLGSVSAGRIIGKVFTFALLNSGIIPVALYVTVRAARTLQRFQMESDAALVLTPPPDGPRGTAVLRAGQPKWNLSGWYWAWTNGAPPQPDDPKPEPQGLRVRSMDLNDELGQVSHVFSDKTGTLTLNEMEFCCLCVAGAQYGLVTNPNASTNSTPNDQDDDDETDQGDDPDNPFALTNDPNPEHPSRLVVPPSIDDVKERWQTDATDTPDSADIPCVRFRDQGPHTLTQDLLQGTLDLRFRGPPP